MDSRKRMALILPFAGLTGFGLGGFAPSSSALISNAQAGECEKAVHNASDCDCVGDSSSNDSCSVTIRVRKDKDGNVIETEKECKESPGCEC